MRTLVSVLAAIALVVWSLISWAAHGLVGLAGGIASTNADLLPVPPEWIVAVSQAMGGLTWLGEAAVWVVWGIGALVIVGLAMLGRALASRRSGYRPDQRYGPSVDRWDGRR